MNRSKPFTKHTTMPQFGAWFDCETCGLHASSYYLREDAEQAALQHESQVHK